MADEEIVVSLYHDRDTKNMHRFSNNDQDTPVPAFYVSRESVEQNFGEMPGQIEITIRPAA